ncbi:hypothetical protein [Streptomyces sp. NBC_00893]|uniref:hypothetical protein n=1 Tax=Streptomyces sp. NBC_00893 TaxID=2975862 RepID=UPI002256387F|nr:hypothetical protein [Streptomyces sp. NBC_00893]MCX4846258.1 hypothetical protein [Streptomyces sp. NBC_00893]
MDNSHAHVTRPALVGSAGPVVPARSSNAWAAPTIATVLSFFLTCFGMFAIGFAAMATDSCGPDNCSSGITVPLSLMAYGLYVTPFITPLALVAAWVLAWWRPRWTTARLCAAAIAVLPGLTALGGLALLLTLGG